MDNLENGGTDPQEAADVNAASGQSDEVETQPETETETTDEGTVEETGTAQPWESDDRFKGKTAEEMYEIVKEADRYRGSLGQKAKAMDTLSQKFGLTPERIAEIAAEEANAAEQNRIRQNPVEHVMNELQEVKQQLFVEKEDAKLEKFLIDQPQYANFKDEIRNLGYTVHRDKEWPQIAEKYFGKAIAIGKESAYTQIKAKEQSQATGVSRGDVKTSLTLEEMKKMTAAELEAYLS